MYNYNPQRNCHSKITYIEYVYNNMIKLYKENVNCLPLFTNLP